MHFLQYFRIHIKILLKFVAKGPNPTDDKSVLVQVINTNHDGLALNRPLENYLNLWWWPLVQHIHWNSRTVMAPTSLPLTTKLASWQLSVSSLHASLGHKESSALPQSKETIFFFFHSVHGFVSMCYVCNPRPPYILILGCAWWEGIELVMYHHFYLTCLSWLYWGKDVTICWATLQWNTWNIYHIMSIIIFAINWVVCVLSAMHFHLMVHRTFVLHFIITITSQLLRYTSFATVWG